ncbi:MAG: collagenase [Bacteroidetes bacterium 38_7]|nr:MAG: collagenase [Bacteroidetes bacterium 38_7]HAL65543.1 collagenase-like protease [Bacteroidales bacterium]
MSPVGSFESLMAAIQGGANAVYFGASKLNMRSRSSTNFTLSDLNKISTICKENGIRSYLTLNSIIYDEELQEMQNIVDTAKESGISAIIASDPSVISYAAQKGVEVHLSTQCNVTNIEAVKWYSRYADVIVLARELNLQQIKQIVDAINSFDIRGPSGNLIAIEIFVHGALCMAISGKCYLSLHSMNSSANRGACLQICRRRYDVTDKETGTVLEIDNEYIMSPKDLCTIGILDQILATGVRVLKIEGRGRSPEYVKTVTQVYHEGVEAVLNRTFSQKKVSEWTERLRTVYNRGFWEGYYLGKELGEWTQQHGSQATIKKHYLGKVLNYFSKLGVAEVKLETSDLKTGDKYSINGPTSGVVEGTVDELRLEYDNIPLASKGQICSFKVSAPVRRGDKVFLLIENSQSII